MEINSRETSTTATTHAWDLLLSSLHIKLKSYIQRRVHHYCFVYWLCRSIANSTEGRENRIKTETQRIRQISTTLARLKRKNGEKITHLLLWSGCEQTFRNRTDAGYRSTPPPPSSFQCPSQHRSSKRQGCRGSSSSRPPRFGSHRCAPRRCPRRCSRWQH